MLPLPYLIIGFYLFMGVYFAMIMDEEKDEEEKRSLWFKIIFVFLWLPMSILKMFSVIGDDDRRKETFERVKRKEDKHKKSKSIIP